MTEPTSLPASAQPVDIHEALTHVRHLPEFRPPGSDQTWEKLQQDPSVRRFFESLQESLDRLVEALAQAFSGVKLPSAIGHDTVFEQIFRGALLFLLFFGILVLLYFLLTLLRRWLDRSPPARPAGSRVIEGIPLQDRAFHESKAHTLAKAGQYPQAICHVYLALLCLLDETGKASLEPSRSNREYLLLLRKNSLDTITKAFQQIAMAFESVRFGRKAPDLEAYQACMEHYESLKTHCKNDITTGKAYV